MFRKIVVLTIVILLGVVVSSSAASAQVSPALVVSPNHDWVDGYDWPESVTIDLYIDDDADLGNGSLFYISGEIGAGEHWINFELREVFDIQAGHHVTMTDGATTKILLVSNLVVTNVNPDTDTVSGTADSGSEVHVWIEGCVTCDVRVTADSGTWLVDFPDGTLVPGTWYPAEQEEEDGDRTQVPWLVPNPPEPGFAVIMSHNEVHAYDWPLGSIVTLEIDDPSNGPSVDYDDAQPSIITSWDPNQTWSLFQLGDAFTLMPGHEVTVSDGITPKSHTVTHLMLDGVDPDTDDVYGTATPDTRVQVWIGEDPGANIEAVADGVTGMWSVDFTGIYNFGSGNSIYASQHDNDGDATRFDYQVPNPTIEARPLEDVIVGWQWALGTEVHLTIDNPTNGLGIDYEATKTVEATPWNPNETMVSFELWEIGCDLQAFHIVVMTDDFTEKIHVVTPLEVTDMDPGTNTVFGLGAADSQVQLWHMDEELWVPTADDGSWSATFNALPPGTWSSAAQFDIDGDQTWINWNVPNPNVVVFPLENRAEGWEWAMDIEVTLEIDDPDTPESPDYSTVGSVGPVPWGGEGSYVNFEFGDVHNVLPGHFVTLSDGVTTKVHVVTNLDVIKVNPNTDIVTGTADSGSSIDLWHCDEFGCANRHVTANGSGDWSADFSVPGPGEDEQGIYDFEIGSWVDVTQWDDDGDATWIGGYVPNTRIQAWPENGYVEGFEWDDGNLVHLEIYASPDPEAELLYSSSEYSGPAPWDPMTTWLWFELPTIDLSFGHYIRMWDETTIKEHTVQYIETINASPDLEEVYGLAEPYSVVRVIPHEFWEGETYPTADSEGQWTAHFSGTYDVAPGSGFSVVREDDDGDGTWIDWWVPMPFIEVFDGIQAFNFTPEAEIEITVFDAYGVPVFGPEMRSTDSEGYQSIHYTKLGCHFLTPGDHVIVRDVTTDFTKELWVSGFTIDEINPDVNTVSGSAEPGARLWLYVEDAHGWSDMEVFADPGGLWIADFGSVDFDVHSYTRATAWLSDEDGDSTMRQLPTHVRADSVRVLPFLDGHEYTLCPGQAARVNWGWTEVTPENVDAFVTAIDQHTYTLDSDLLLSTPDSQTLWGPLEPRGPNEACGWDASWVRWWEYEIVDLEPGDHSLTIFLSLGQPAPQMCGGEGEVSGTLWENRTVTLHVIPGPNDVDADGHEDDADNCPWVPNRDQADFDDDGVGDKCDDDDDNDGMIDSDELIIGTDPFNPDTDGDGVLDGPDNCPMTPNLDQADFDLDGMGDACDPDDDDDGVLDAGDNCPVAYNPAQVDTDIDGLGDVCDPDDDDDGVLDAGDNCPVAYNPAQVDTDMDGLGDVCDPDDDDDGVLDAGDNCPVAYNPAQVDTDMDGLGDVCDPDDDDDGVLDSDDSCPFEDATGFDADVDGCIDTPEGLLLLINTLEDDVLSDEIKNSLAVKIEHAMKSLDKGRENAAIGQLEAFINQVEAQRGKKISDETADLLISYAENLISQIEGG